MSPVLIIKYIVVFIFFLTVAGRGISQETGAYYLLPKVSQTSFFNPAAQNNNDKLIIGIPVFSGISGSWNANVPFDALFNKDFSYSFERFYNQLESTGEANASARISMFYASLKYNDYTFRMSVSERLVTTGNFNKDIIKIIRDGTAPYYGNAENFGKGNFHFLHFRELLFGFSKKVWDNLDIGINSKILSGKAAFEGTGLQLSVETDPDNDVLLVEPEGDFLMTGPMVQRHYPEIERTVFLSNIYPGDYFFQPRNLGIAMDFGVIYRPNEFSEVSASLTDIGFVALKYNTFDVDLFGSASFSEDDLYQSTDPDADFYLEPREALLAFGDTVANVIDVKETRERTLLLMPLALNLSANYRISDKITSGIHNQFTWFRNQPRNYFAAFLQMNAGKRIDFSGSLSLYNLSAIRPGLGVTWTLPGMQFYFSSNNILGIIQPTSSKHLNLSVGMNFLFDTQ